MERPGLLATYLDTLAELGFRTPDDLTRRKSMIVALLPATMQMAEAIMDANPAVRDD